MSLVPNMRQLTDAGGYAVRGTLPCSCACVGQSWWWQAWALQALDWLQVAGRVHEVCDVDNI